MLNKDLRKFLTNLTMGLALSTTVNITLPSVSLAQKQPVKSTPRQQPVIFTPPKESVKSTPSIATDYLLGGGDRIRVNVFEVPEYTGEYQVPPGGSINMPLIGSIPVSGLTTEQAADTIAKRYARFLKRPLISVNLLSPRPINVFVAGEVTRPGAYTLSLEGGAGNNPGVQYPTVLAALTTAQGVTLAADVTQVQLRRKTGRSGEQTVSLNLKELTQTGRISQDITLRDGDTIVVPTATSLNVAEARNLFAANFAASQSSPRTVVVIGQVYRPGSYLVTTGSGGGAESSGGGGAAVAGGGLPTVMRSLQLAGGITSLADVRKIKLRRPTRTGTEQSIDINLWKLLETGDINQDIIVQDGDTSIIPTATDISAAEATQLATTTLSPTTIEVGVVGEVKRAGAVKLQPNSSLNQALLAAGGFNDSRASRGSVELIRLNANGTVTKRPIKVDLTKGINEETNPILRNNDVVVVDRNTLAKTGDRVNTVAGPLGTILGIIRLFTTGF